MHAAIHASMPKKLPRRQVVDYKIKLVPSATQFSQPSYRMSPREVG